MYYHQRNVLIHICIKFTKVNRHIVMITDFLGLRKEFVPLSSVAYVSLSVKKIGSR